MMDSPLFGNQEAQLITIETPYFTFYLKGEKRDLSHTKVSSEDLALYGMQCMDQVSINIMDVISEQNHYLQMKALPLFFEQTSYQVVIDTDGHHQVGFDHDSSIIRSRIDRLGRSGVLAGVINFGNEVGLTELRVMVDGQPYLRLTIEIYPIKLSYKSDYLKLREDVANEVYNLTFDFMRSTYLGAKLIESDKPSLTEFYSIFQKKCEELIKSIEFIMNTPYHELQALHEIRSYKEGAKIGPKGIQYLMKHPQQIQSYKGKLIPNKYLHTAKQITTDVYENQLVKYLTRQIVSRLKSVQKQYQLLRRESDPHMLDIFSQSARSLEQKLEGSFFRQVSKLERVQAFSMVIQMSPIYMKFYKLYLTLQMGLSIWTGLFNISNKNIAELYEYWCFIKLGSLLKSRHELIYEESRDLLNKESLFVTLKKGKASTLSFRHHETGEVFTLSYNQVEKTPTVTQKPDNMLSLNSHGKTGSYQYVLDAKYRIEYEKGEVEVPKEEDINTMHRYRDAIVYKNSESVYEKSVVGAIILFPGSFNEAYTETRFYKSIQTVNIGGLPFLPSNTKFVEEFLEELLSKMMGKTKNLIDYSKLISLEADFIAESETIHYK